MKQPITLCSVVFNEIKRIEEFINYHKDYFDEIIILDNGSIDGTVQKMWEMGNIKVIQDKHRGIAENSRHIVALNASNEWILFLDADEFATEELLNALPDLITGEYDGYILERSDYCDGIYQVSEFNQYRLFKKTNVVFHWELHGGIEPKQCSKITRFDKGIRHVKTSEEYRIDHNIYESIILNNPEAINPLWYMIYQVKNFPIEQLITLVSTTSAKHDMSVDKIDKMLKSYDDHFGTKTFNKVIVADGFNPIRNENNRVYDSLGEIQHSDYRKYMDDLRPYCIHRGITLIELHENKGMFGAMLAGTMKVGTPYYLYTTDDIYAKRDINLHNIIRGMSENLYIKRVNFHDNILGYSEFQSILEEDNSPHFNCLKTNFMSGNTHISYTFLSNFIYGRRIRELGKYPLELAFKKEFDRLVDTIGFFRAHRIFGNYIYGSMGEPAIVEHDFSYLDQIEKITKSS
jgi:glycosyltransferase involved in cell wall biosynthesis